ADCSVQLLAVTVTGQYSLRSTSIGGTIGGYQLKVLLNSALEMEAHGGAANELLASAEPLDRGMFGLVGSAARAAVAGTLTIVPGLPGPQYASSVIGFSSQLGPTLFSAAQALGAPNATSYGHRSSAWAADLINNGQQYLAVGFAQPAFSNGIVI